MAASDRFALLTDAILQHRHHLARVENAVVRDLLAPLQDVLEDAVERLRTISPARRSQLLDLVAEILGQLTRGYQTLGQTVPTALTNIAAAEAAFDLALLRRALGGGVTLGTVQAEALAATGWRAALARQAADLASALRVSTSLALTSGEGPQGIAARFSRSASLAQSAAEGMTREAIAETATAIDLQVFGLTGDEARPIWLSTLDDVTCLVCAERDTLLIDEVGEAPPAHRNCRCAVGLAEPGIPRADRRRRANPGGWVRVRTYETWLRRQSAEFQRDALGPSRYALFKKGKLSLRSFVDDGRTLSLAELERQHTRIFADLGLAG